MQIGNVKATRRMRRLKHFLSVVTLVDGDGDGDGDMDVAGQGGVLWWVAVVVLQYCIRSPDRRFCGYPSRYCLSGEVMANCYDKNMMTD